MKVFKVPAVDDEWLSVSNALNEAFRFTQTAAIAGEHVVYLVHNDDLLGRRGAGAAMVACGLLSAARSAALEGVKNGWRINVLATEDNTDPGLLEAWLDALHRTGGPTGELVHLGPSHLGKALP